MTRFWRLILALIACASPVSAGAKDALCEQLDKLAAAQRHAPEPIIRQWVEIRFGVDHDPLTLWSMQCLHSTDKASAQFCDWFTQSGNGGEFARQNLTRTALTCFGVRLPERARVEVSIDDATLYKAVGDDYRMAFEVKSGNLNGAWGGAMRFSFDSGSRSLTPQDLPEMGGDASE